MQHALRSALIKFNFIVVQFLSYRQGNLGLDYEESIRDNCLFVWTLHDTSASISKQKKFLVLHCPLISILGIT